MPFKRGTGLKDSDLYTHFLFKINLLPLNLITDLTAIFMVSF